VSRSMTSAHVFVKGRISRDVDRREIMGVVGYVEVYGYPDNSQVIGTTWLHIEDAPRHTVPERQDMIDEFVDEYVDGEDQLSD